MVFLLVDERWNFLGWLVIGFLLMYFFLYCMCIIKVFLVIFFRVVLLCWGFEGCEVVVEFDLVLGMGVVFFDFML